jgi:predicted acylesterase/phospholipase RssA
MSDIKITHLVLSGGGMRGVMFIGALRLLYLENLHKNITHISANSIGSFIGLMIAFKLTIEEMEKIIYDMKDDNTLCFIPIKNYIRFITEYGFFSIELFMNHLIILIKNKYPDMGNDITFMELSKRFGINLYISTTNINRCENRIFSIDNTPDNSVFRACEASMSVPLLFKPIKIDDEYYYDGALTNNFPIKIFSGVPKENILGMILYSDNKQHEDDLMRNKKINIFFILKQLFNIFDILRTQQVLLKQINTSEIDNYYMPTIITNQKTLNFKLDKMGVKMILTNDQIESMIYAGYDSMSKFIDKRRSLVKDEYEKRLEYADIK